MPEMRAAAIAWRLADEQQRGSLALFEVGHQALSQQRRP